MARVKGGDVLLQLMDTVAQLEATAKQHAEQIQEIARLGIETSARVTGLGNYTAGIGKQLHDVSKRMDDVSKRMDDVTNRVDGVANNVDLLARGLIELGDDLTQQAQNFVEASKTARLNIQQLARLTQLLSAMNDGSQRRFVEIEGRLTALEKKTG